MARSLTSSNGLTGWVMRGSWFVVRPIPTGDVDEDGRIIGNDTVCAQAYQPSHLPGIVDRPCIYLKAQLVGLGDPRLVEVAMVAGPIVYSHCLDHGRQRSAEIRRSQAVGEARRPAAVAADGIEVRLFAAEAPRDQFRVQLAHRSHHAPVEGLHADVAAKPEAVDLADHEPGEAAGLVRIVLFGGIALDLDVDA